MNQYSVLHGSLKYSEVTAFLQRQHSVVTQYKSITTLSNETITVSPSHLIYTRENINDKFEAR